MASEPTNKSVIMSIMTAPPKFQLYEQLHKSPQGISHP